MEPNDSRLHQTRSNSISGHDFNHISTGYQRTNQIPQYSAQPIAFVDNQQAQIYLGAQRQYQTHLPYYQQNVPLRKSPSPMGSNPYRTHHFSNVSQREDSFRYGQESRIPRNHLHASLEGINSTHHFADHHSHQLHHNTNANHYQQATQSQNYAASYVLAVPPENTVINHSGDQDLAAAAMGPNPPRQQSLMSELGSLKNGYGCSNQHNLNLSGKTITHVPQSPLKRTGGLNINLTGSSTNNCNLLSSPIRGGYSSLSLASSSLIIEEKLQNEIKKLQCELKSEKEKNEALSSQLNINVSVIIINNILY